ncbi:MAG: FecR domain-containing protein [Candidatus Marinimicrobia bacterium]|nr:FecR domain-containing protein [Candidatus Neomarinimicrobiota bacterium]
MNSLKIPTVLRILILTIILSSNGYAQDADESALALKKRGEAFRKPYGVNTLDEQVEVGMWFSNYDSVRTGQASFLAILFTDDKSIVKMKENTNLTIQRSKTPTQTLRQIRINQGKMKIKVTPQLEGKYEIITAVSVASIKGTEFWLLVNPDGTDTFIGLEGSVQILNIESGQSMLLTAGMTVISQWTGVMNIGPTDPSTIPSDPEETPEDSGQPEDSQPIQEDTQQAPTPKPGNGGGSGGGLPGGMTFSASVGASVLDGQVYNQISLRPEFPIGPLGIGLDLNFYFDADGNLREEDWDEAGDIIDKILYIRYHNPSDPTYLRAGALTGVTMGQGLIMDNYSNMIEFPQVRRVGLFGHKEFGKFRLQGLVANLRELGNPGLLGVRASLPVIGKLRIGATYVVDGDQFGGLSDKDGDGVPDAFDDFPDNDSLSIDTDGDGIADELDFDRDGDGFTDNFPGLNNDADGVELKTTLNLKDTSSAVSIFGIDFEYPLVSNNLLGLTLYSEFAAIKDFGSGFAMPGVRATIGPLFVRAEYRSYNSQFVGNYFNRTYDLERVITIERADGSITAITREDTLLNSIVDPLTGVFGGASLDFLGLLTFSSFYSSMSSSNDSLPKLQSLFADISINPVFIPKISRASLFYQQTNVDNVFDFEKTPSTLIGYAIGYEIAPSITLLIRSQQTYVDKNGDGKIRGDDEKVRLTSIETVFTF